MQTIVFKLVLKSCERCKLLSEVDEGILGCEIEEKDYDSLTVDDPAYEMMEYVCGKHGVNSITFPFYIFFNGEEVEYINGASSGKELETKIKELRLV